MSTGQAYLHLAPGAGNNADGRAPHNDWIGHLGEDKEGESGLVFLVGLWRQFRSERSLAVLSADAGLVGAIILFAMVGVSAGALRAEAFVAGCWVTEVEDELPMMRIPFLCQQGDRAPPSKERLTTLAMQEFPLTVTRTIRRNSRRSKNDAAPGGESEEGAKELVVG